MATSAPEPRPGIGPPADLYLDPDSPEGWGPWEIGEGGQGAAWDTNGGGQNWPYGYLFDGGRFGAPGGPCVQIVEGGGDHPQARAGNRLIYFELRQGCAAYYGGQDQGGNIDACWAVGATYPQDTHWGTSSSPYPSNYRPGEARTDQLPPDADIIGRRSCYGFSIFLDDATTYGGYYVVGADWHAGAAAGAVSYPQTRIVDGCFCLTVRGSGSPGTPTPWRQHDIAFNLDGSFYQDFSYSGSGSPDFPGGVSSEWQLVPRQVWIDLLFIWDWDDDPAYGGVQLLAQVDKSGAYVECIPYTRLPSLYTTMVNGDRKSADICTYFGMYRPRGVSEVGRLWMDEIRRTGKPETAMIPGSTLPWETTPGPEPEPDELVIVQNLKDGDTISGVFVWTAVPSGPVQAIEFAIDGNQWTKEVTAAPYEWALDTVELGVGPHQFGLTATLPDGSVVWEPYQVGTVNVAAEPPPEPEPDVDVELAKDEILDAVANDVAALEALGWVPPARRSRRDKVALPSPPVP
jgi:hypothetical protein